MGKKIEPLAYNPWLFSAATSNDKECLERIWPEETTEGNGNTSTASRFLTQFLSHGADGHHAWHCEIFLSMWSPHWIWMTYSDSRSHQKSWAWMNLVHIQSLLFQWGAALHAGCAFGCGLWWFLKYDSLTFLTEFVSFNQSDFLNHCYKDPDMPIVACFMRV